MMSYYNEIDSYLESPAQVWADGTRLIQALLKIENTELNNYMKAFHLLFTLRLLSSFCTATSF